MLLQAMYRATGQAYKPQPPKQSSSSAPSKAQGFVDKASKHGMDEIIQVSHDFIFALIPQILKSHDSRKSLELCTQPKSNHESLEFWGRTQQVRSLWKGRSIVISGGPNNFQSGPSFWRAAKVMPHIPAGRAHLLIGLLILKAFLGDEVGWIS